MSLLSRLDLDATIKWILAKINRLLPQHLRGNIQIPNAVQDNDNEVLIWPATDVAITITKISISLDAAGNEVTGDLKWADAFIGLANATVINDFDTTSGVRVDDSITAGSVAAGKCLYFSFDSSPSADIKQMGFDIEYKEA